MPPRRRESFAVAFLVTTELTPRARSAPSASLPHFSSQNCQSPTRDSNTRTTFGSLLDTIPPAFCPKIFEKHSLDQHTVLCLLPIQSSTFGSNGFTLCKISAAVNGDRNLPSSSEIPSVPTNSSANCPYSHLPTSGCEFQFSVVTDKPG